MTRAIALLALLLTWHLGATQDLLISNARIIDGTGETMEQGSIVVRDGQIVSVSAGTSPAQGSRQIDAQGMTVMPGLINTHWHLLAGSGAADDEAVDQYVEDVVVDELESLLTRGVTTIMSPGDHFPNILEIRHRLRSGDMRGPRLLAVGPVFTAPDDWPTQLCRGNSDCKAMMTAELTDPELARAKVRELAAAGVDAVKLVYDDRIARGVRIDDEVVAAIADEARANGLILFAHISTADETALAVVELGARGLVHPVALRSAASSNGAQTLRDLRIPVSTTISGRTREWYELTGRDYSQQLETVLGRRLEDIKHLWNEGVIVAFGTDTVAGPDSFAEGRFLAEARALNQVLSNDDVVTSLTRNAAAYLGLDDELGTLEPGKIADIILVDGDPLADIAHLARVQVVIQGGRVVVDKRSENIETVRIVASGQRYSPRQSVAPAGTPRHTANYDVTVTWNPGGWQAREEWLQHNLYPLETDLPFTMTYHETAGIKDGRDSFGLPSPVVGPMDAARIGANFKDLWLTNPIILSGYSDALPATPISLGGVTMERVVLSAHDTQWVMIVDATGLPAEVTTTEADPNNAQAPNRVVFSDWREVSGVPFPFQVEQYLNGRLLRREIRSSIEVNPRDANRQLELADDLEGTDEALRAWGWSMSHLLLARAGLGGPADTPQIENVQFNEVGPDIYQVAGGSHHGLAIVGPDGIAMVDAPWFPERSATILRQMEERWPGLPVRYVILTHHHLDHTGGFRGFVEAGATLVAHKDAVPFFEEALTLAGHPSMRAVAVSDQVTLEGIGRAVAIYDLPNTHSDAAVMAYVPDAKLLFNADIYSPGRELQFTWMQDLFAAVRYHGLDVERHVGGHGAGYDSGPD